jgi:hypothetical protein
MHVTSVATPLTSIFIPAFPPHEPGHWKSLAPHPHLPTLVIHPARPMSLSQPLLRPLGLPTPKSRTSHQSCACARGQGGRDVHAAIHCHSSICYELGCSCQCVLCSLSYDELLCQCLDVLACNQLILASLPFQRWALMLPSHPKMSTSTTNLAFIFRQQERENQNPHADAVGHPMLMCKSKRVRCNIGMALPDCSSCSLDARRSPIQEVPTRCSTKFLKKYELTIQRRGDYIKTI